MLIYEEASVGCAGVAGRGWGLLLTRKFVSDPPSQPGTSIHKPLCKDDDVPPTTPRPEYDPRLEISPPTTLYHENIKWCNTIICHVDPRRGHPATTVTRVGLQYTKDEGMLGGERSAHIICNSFHRTRYAS
jgi:hypothetical protein